MFPDELVKTDEARKFVDELNANRTRVRGVLEALGLDHVGDTFVGDQNVRGVSGGQRRRVTLGEMLMDSNPIICGDEISTGLDAASTFDIVQTLVLFAKTQKHVRVISLLQPSPETVSLFDEVILLAEGRLLYAGPVANVEGYFADLGYKAPEQMDVADFLQHLTVSTDAAKLFDPPEDIKEERATPYSSSELADMFRKSEWGQKIRMDLQSPLSKSWKDSDEKQEGLDSFGGLDTYKLKRKYANSFFRLTWLNVKRMLTLWIRDKRLLITSAIKVIVMAASIGGVFFQTDDYTSILGVLFQGTLFILLGTSFDFAGAVLLSVPVVWPVWFC